MTSVRPRSVHAKSNHLFRTVLPFAVGLVSIGFLLYSATSDVNGLAVALAAAILLVLLVALALRDWQRAASDTPWDAVTGLATRDALVEELGARVTAGDARPTLLLLLDLHGFKAYNEDFGHVAGNMLLARFGDKLAGVVGSEGRIFRLQGDEFGLVSSVGDGDAERLIEETRAALSEHGDGFTIGCSFGGVLLPFETADPRAALRLADERLSGQRRSRHGIRTVNALVRMLSDRRGTAPVNDGLQSLAVAIGGLMGVHGDRLEALARAAELHEVGKLSIPSEILDKPGELDKREWEFVRQQTTVGERVLRTSPQLLGVAPIIRATCENWDGTGYPDGHAGEEIPLAARIIRVCDAFDAMVTPRPYRPALSPDEALTEIEKHAGTSFDPAVVRVLSALVSARTEASQAA